MKTRASTESSKVGKDLPAGFPHALTREDLAAALGVTVRTVTNWKQEALPRSKDGTYDLPAVITWLVEREASRRAKAPARQEADDSLAEYRRQKTRLVRLRFLREKGKLLPKAEMVKAFTDRAFEIGRALLQLGRRFSARVAAKSGKTLREVEEIHEAEARKLLEDYARPIYIDENAPI
ncbi:MAG: terminase small subunit [Candidatus Riflebacteria bacterium]|nr:terminase small subunit [Candidatus Riflebacteria bacterium]